MKSTFTIVAVLIVATYGQEECPRGAEFVISLDVVTSADFFQSVADPNVTFFRDFLQFNEDEIETAARSAIAYFNVTFGLDFSDSMPNLQGQIIYQNASFSAAQAPFTMTAKANRWLVNGNTKSRCFDARLGWFGVTFQDNQMLYGTYGGTEGRMIGPTSLYALSYSYFWINTCPQSPLVIQLQTPTPAFTTPDGVTTALNTAFHRGLGSGIAYSTFHVSALPPDQRSVRLRFYNTMIFPADEIP